MSTVGPDFEDESSRAHVNWLEVNRSPHAIRFYSGDEFMIDSLSEFVGTALTVGDSCFVLATPAHLDRLEERLRAGGIDTNLPAIKGRYTTVDAYKVLARLIVGGKISRARFEEFVEEVILRLQTAAESEPKKVAICGEIVSMLWAEGKPEAAIELEHFWNDLAERGHYYFRCVYPIACFSDPEESELFLKLCAEHSGCIPVDIDFYNVAERVKEFESREESG